MQSSSDSGAQIGELPLVRAAGGLDSRSLPSLDNCVMCERRVEVIDDGWDELIPILRHKLYAAPSAFNLKIFYARRGRIATHITRQQQTHRLRHVISELAAHRPEQERRNESVKELTTYGCSDRMHVVRLLAPMLERENHTKDMDFSASGIRQPWDAGYTHTKTVLEQRPWEGEFDPLAGVILHEREEHVLMAAE